MKQFHWVVVAVLMIGLIAAPASAYTVNTPAQQTVAYELLGTNNLAVKLVGGAANWFIPSSLNTGVTLYMNLSGPVRFNPGTTYSLCANNVPGQNGAVDGNYFLVGDIIGSSATTLSVPLTSASANIFAGSTMLVTSDPACLKNLATATNAQNLILQVPASGAVGNGTLSTALTNFLATNLTYAANTVLTVVNQLSTTMTVADLIQIDYINSPANGTHLVPVTGSTNLIAMSPAKLLVSNTLSGSASVNTIPAGVENIAITLTDSANWIGISSAYLAFSGDCNVSGNYATAVNATPGTSLTLTTPSGYAFPELWQAGSNSVTLCVTVSGNTMLPSRTITGSYVYLPGTRVLFGETEHTQSESRSLRGNVITGAYQAPYGSGSSNTVWQTWTPNGYQAFCPYVYAGGGAAAASNTTFVNDTFVRFVNASSANATVFAEVYNGGSAPTGPYTLGVIAPYSSGTYWGGDLAVMAGVSYGTTFAAQYTVTALPTAVTGASYYKRVNSSGSNDRAIPLLTDIMAPLVDNWPRFIPN